VFFIAEVIQLLTQEDPKNKRTAIGLTKIKKRCN